MTRPNLSILSHPLAHFINPRPRSTYRVTPESSECSKDIEHLCSDSLGSTLHDDSIPSDGSANVRALTKPDKHKSCGATKSLRRFGSHAAQHSAAQRSVGNIAVWEWETDPQRNAVLTISDLEHFSCNAESVQLVGDTGLVEPRRPHDFRSVIDRIVERSGPHRPYSLIGTRDIIASRAELLPPWDKKRPVACGHA
jgi:hypothetical protein